MAEQPNVTIRVKILKKSAKLVSYMRNNREMTYFNLVVAEGSNVFRMRVYLRSKFNMITEGGSFKFINIVKKGDKDFWVTSQSTIGYCSIVETDDQLEVPLLPEEMPAEGETKSLKDALRSPDKSTVSGKIVKVSPVHYRQDGNLAVRAVLLKDTSSLAKVCLFGQQAENPYQSRDMLKVTSVYPKKYMERTQMTCCPTSKVEFIPDDPTITITDIDGDMANEDPDFDETAQTEQIQCITLTDFTDVDIYDCCQVEACRMKKFVNGKCPICTTEKTSKKSYRVQFLYSTTAEKDKKLTLFQSTLEKIIGERIDYDTKELFISSLVQKLPIQFNASLSASNSVYNISTT